MSSKSEDEGFITVYIGRLPGSTKHGFELCLFPDGMIQWQNDGGACEMTDDDMLYLPAMRRLFALARVGAAALSASKDYRSELRDNLTIGELL